MQRPLFLLLLAVALPAGLAAQLSPLPEHGIGMGHLHLRVDEADYPQFRHMIIDGLGARPAAFGQNEAFLIPDAVILVAKGNLEGESAGTSVNHIGFLVKNLAAAEAKWRAAGGEVLPQHPIPIQSYVMLPGGTRVEITEDPTLTVPIRNHHIHFSVPSDVEAQAWYQKVFGAVPGVRRVFKKGDLPGVELSFSNSRTPVVGTKGHAIDHIGFEVNGLEAFCKKLEGMGITLDRPYTPVPQLGISIAFLTDPWGTYIELTEGLSKIQ